MLGFQTPAAAECDTEIIYKTNADGHVISEHKLTCSDTPAAQAARAAQRDEQQSLCERLSANQALQGAELHCGPAMDDAEDLAKQTAVATEIRRGVSTAAIAANHDMDEADIDSVRATIEAIDARRVVIRPTAAAFADRAPPDDDD